MMVGCMGRDSEEARLDAARSVIQGAGGGELDRRPWQQPNEGPDDATLVRFVLWRVMGQVGSASTSELEAGLALIGSARSDLDAVETALVFTARAEGLTWARIAEAMGLRSPQAAQQRFQRTADRPAPSGPASGSRLPGGDRD